MSTEGRARARAQGPGPGPGPRPAPPPTHPTPPAAALNPGPAFCGHELAMVGPIDGCCIDKWWGGWGLRVVARGWCGWGNLYGQVTSQAKRDQPPQPRARSTFWGVWGAQLPRMQGGAGGRSPPASPTPQIQAKIIVELPILRVLESAFF